MLKVGDKIKDNDPRMPNRVLTVMGLGPGGVDAKSADGRTFSISLKRVFTDSKPRRTGFSLVQ